MSAWIWFMVAGTLCWIVYAAPAKPAPGEVVPWQGIFVKVAGGRWIDRAAQIQAESRFDPMAQSPVGAKGGAQFMDATWKEWGHGSPYDPSAFIPANHNFMTWIEARVGGQLDPGLASYNWSLGRVLQIQRRIAAIGEPGNQAWVRLCPAETQGYLLHNSQNRARIRALGGKP